MKKNNNKLNDTKKIQLICIFIIVILIVISFFPSLKNGFTNWDDDRLVLDNPHIKSLSFANIIKIFSSFHLGHYNPFVILSFAIEYHFFKLEPLIYHITNLFLHICNSILVFIFIYLISKSNFISSIASILFGIHPLHVESVAWITERKDVLYSFFFLLSLIYYIKYKQISNRNFYFVSLLLFIFALLSKGLAITLPVVFLLCDYLLNQKDIKKLLIEKFPFLFFTIVFAVIALLGTYSSGATKAEHVYAFSDNFFMANYGLLFYFRKILFPLNLSALYPFPIKGSDFFTAEFTLSPFVNLIIFIAVAYSSKFTRKIVFGMAFFLVTIFPVLQIIPSGPAIAADRYIYIPSIGLFFIFAEFLFYLFFVRLVNKKILRNILFIITGIIIIIFSILTYKRTHVWKDSLTLWNDVITKYPQSIVAYNNRGSHFLYKKDYQSALKDFDMALKINPNHFRTHYNLGILYTEINEYDKAIKSYKKTLNVYPDYLDALNNLGIVYVKIGNKDDAFEIFNNVLKKNPNNAEAYNNRGLILMEKGEYDNAIEDFTKAVKSKIFYPQAYYNRGLAFYLKKNYDKAIRDFSEAIKTSVNYSEAYFNRALTYYILKDMQKALNDLNQSLKIKPNYFDAYKLRGNIYDDSGLHNKAIEDFSEAIKINAKVTEIYLDRGVAFIHKKEFDNAINDFKTALEINPQTENAYNNLAVVYYMKKDYDNAWEIVNEMQKKKFALDEKFLESLRKDSNR